MVPEARKITTEEIQYFQISLREHGQVLYVPEEENVPKMWDPNCPAFGSMRQQGGSDSGCSIGSINVTG